MKKYARIFAAALLISSLSVPVYAANPFQELFEDALYGGLAGALIGGAAMAFTKHPVDHFAYLGYGSAVGVIAGATYGVVKTTRTLAEYENGKIRFAIPSVMPELYEANVKGQTVVGFKADLLRGNF